MQVSLDKTGSLERRLTVAVPAERIEQRIRQRLGSLAKTAKIAGFRPGKIPMSVVEKRYGLQVRDEVMDELVNATFAEAVSQEKLRPAGLPKIESRHSVPGQGLEYTAVFEVYPEIELQATAALAIEKPVPQVTEQDVDAMLERMRRQRPDYLPVDRAAQDGDQLIVDLGREDGRPEAGHQVPVVIGSRALHRDFEDALIGAAAGDEKGITITFEPGYHDPKVAGQTVTFQVKVIGVAEPHPPALDDAFAVRCGVAEGGLEALRREVRDSMQREAEEAVKEVVRARVLERLRETNRVEVPKSLVDDELRRIAAEPGGAALTPEVRQAAAADRVTVGLLIAEIITRNDFKARPEAVRAKVEAMAMAYDEPKKVLEWYYSDRRRLRQIESLVLEEQAVGWLMERAQITETPMGYNDLMKARHG